MSGCERLAEAHGGVTPASALLVELAPPRVELVGHLVERQAELGELVPALDLHSAVEPAARDLVRSGGEAAEPVHDRPPLEVRDQDQQHERDQHRHDEPLA